MVDFLQKLSSFEQDDFVRDRQIIDGIILMHEVVHSIKSSKEEAMIIKLDM